jgi:hypothetical protein
MDILAQPYRCVVSMPSLCLLLSDELLCRALTEQFRASWDIVTCKDWAEVAATKAEVLLAEVSSLPEKEPDIRPSLIFAMAAAGEKIPAFDLTETFAKPVRLGHLAARLQWQWTSFQRARDLKIKLGIYVFLPHQKIMTSDEGETIKLTEKETSLLAYLAEAGRAVPRDELLAEIWGYDGRIDTHTLETHIYRLRSQPSLRDLILVKQGFYEINPTWRTKD